MAKPRPWVVERLEDRSTPAHSGVTWADGEHLTLSFVPDGTRVAGHESSLFRTLNAVAPTATWQREIVRAFQTWAAQANLNVGVVPDGGQELGAGGAVQGDARFGDIRIAAAPMAAGTLMTNTPFQWSGTTWSGDVVVNSNYRFGLGGSAGGYDLFTAMLNEAGNVFGVTDSRTDATSGVYYSYAGAKSGLNTADIADIHGLYGARAADRYDAASPNSSFASATGLGLALTGLDLEADVTSATDVDYYKFTVPVTGTPVVGLTARVTTAGHSSLAPKLAVYDANRNLVGSTTIADALRGDGTVTVRGGLGALLSQLLSGSTYYLRVSGAQAGAFGVGGYRLSVGYQLADGTVTASVGTPLTGTLLSLEVNTNDVLGAATGLTSRLTPTPDARFDYTHRASIAEARDVDYYKVKAPADARKMNAVVWGLEHDRLRPQVEVFDAAGRPVAATLLANEHGTFSVEVAQVTPGASYFVKVSALDPSGGKAVGNYFLGVDFNAQPPTALTTYASGTLTQAVPQHVKSATVAQNRLYEFILSADAAGAAASVRMEILDANGNVVFTLTSAAGRPASTGHVYLKAGQYKLRFTGLAPAGAALPNVSYHLSGRLVSDPIGPMTSEASESNAPQTDESSEQMASAENDWARPTYW